MKQINLILIFSGMLLAVSCTPNKNPDGSVQKSESTVKVKTEVTAKETPVEPAPAIAKPGKIETQKPQNPVIKMITTKGGIEIELYADKAPITVENFLSYIKSGFYNGTVFHRVISGFMIQGGGLTADLQEKPANAPIKNESYNHARNERGTIAMARTNDPDSATSQFFINLVNNHPLDFDGPYQPGYAVFGKVVKGMEVVDTIAAMPTKRVGPNANVPLETVTIKSVTVME